MSKKNQLIAIIKRDNEWFFKMLEKMLCSLKVSKNLSFWKMYYLCEIEKILKFKERFN